MKRVFAFLRLVRSLNLVFIALTQFLFQYCIIRPILEQAGVAPLLGHVHFVLLTFASVAISGAGYIINDYFDLNIDRVNKPDKLVVEKLIHRRVAILWHLFLSAIGIMISIYVGFRIRNIVVPVVNLLCVALLWFYSTTFKKKLLIGNIIISLLTAWVVMVLYFCEINRYAIAVASPQMLHALSKIFKLAVLYGGFAFIISLIREVIKDVEDMNGDERYGCRTMPIVWGVQISKVFVATWLIVVLAALGILEVYVLQFRWWWAMLYCLLLVMIPLLGVFRRLFTAISSKDFHRLSSQVKWIMLLGILSMVVFKIYI